MTTLTEGTYTADFLKRELERLIGRKLVTIENGAGVLKKGTVLGMKTSSKKFWAYDPTKSDGTQLTTAAQNAVLLQDVDASSADVANVPVIWALGALDTAFLLWSAGVTTQAHKDAAYAGLALSLLIALAPA